MPEQAVIVDSNATDGYHTFAELYDHRHSLFAVLLRVYAPFAFKTRRNDKGIEWPGWFIAGIDLPTGQISYHLPEVWWQRLSWVREIPQNDNYDGHTADDVVERLRKLALYSYEGVGS